MNKLAQYKKKIFQFEKKKVLKDKNSIMNNNIHKMRSSSHIKF